MRVFDLHAIFILLRCSPQGAVLSSAANESKPLKPPSVGEVTACVERMLSQAQFHDSPQLSAFLKFIVEETLKGKGGELKGYTIATLALGRPADFDPQTDPIVRVQGGRLRQAILDFYAETPAEKIQITLERGTYEPKFSYREPTPLPALANAASESTNAASPLEMAVLAQQETKTPTRWPRSWQAGAALVLAAFMVGMAFAFSTLFTLDTLFTWQKPGPQAVVESYSRYIPEIVVDGGSGPSDPKELTTLVQRTRSAIARFDDIVVVRDAVDDSGVSTLAPVRQTGERLFLRITGSSASEGRLRIGVRLVEQLDQTVIWSREFDTIPAGDAGDEARTRIIRMIVTSVAQPYGVIHAHVRKRLLSGKGVKDPYGCILSTFDYWLEYDRKKHAEVRQCLVDRIEGFPNIAALHAQLATIHLEEYRQGYNPLPGNPLERALVSAQRAVVLAPASARAQQALMAVHFVRKDMESAWRAAEKALTLNPFDTEILADVGARNIQAGKSRTGLIMLEEALELNSAPPNWAVIIRALGLYTQGKADEASALAKTLKGTKFPIAMMAVVMAAFHDKDIAAGKQALAALKQQHPDVFADPPSYIERLNYDPVVAGNAYERYLVAKYWIENQS
jgi:Tfp pilus assembly protein PilF